MTGKWTQLIIGLFVLAGLAAAMALILMFGGLTTFREGYRVTAYFDHVGGVEIGAPVRMGGLQIGKVAETGFVHEKKIRIRLALWIDGRYRIKRDASLSIDSQGVIGESFLNFTTGTSGAGTLPTDGSAQVEGVAPPSIGSLQEEGFALVKELKKTIEETRSLIGLWAGAFEEGKGTLPKLLKDEQLYHQLVDLSANLNRLVQSFERDPSQVIWGPGERTRRVEIE